MEEAGSLVMLLVTWWRGLFDAFMGIMRYDTKRYDANHNDTMTGSCTTPLTTAIRVCNSNDMDSTVCA
jgi:hypothetical protein